MKYVEEREFTLRFSVRCEFPDDYDGDDDGLVWAKEFDAIAAEVVAAAVQAVRRRPGWSVRPANRGRPASEEVTLIIDRTLDSRQS
ncbi:MAG TPA: hypothetical protein VNO55_24190 [Polyangia bacterium]|nr:hypothetical protein [Polyangia bacterium]